MSGSQFYICVADSSGLDRTYTVFGEVFREMEKTGGLVVLLHAERARQKVVAQCANCTLQIR